MHDSLLYVMKEEFIKGNRVGRVLEIHPVEDLDMSELLEMLSGLLH